MFVPSQFKQTESNRIYELMRDHPFAMLCVSTDAGIEAGHVPVHTTRDESGSLSLRFHLSRSNPLVELLDGSRSALIVFTGPHAYISPDWYGTENQVPTWNYAVVQARGKPQTLDDSDLMTLLDDLSSEGEAALSPKKPWTTEKMNDRLYQGMRGAITGFAMQADSLDAKWKMNQNRKPSERQSVKQALTALGTPGHTAVGDEIPD